MVRAKCVRFDGGASAYDKIIDYLRQVTMSKASNHRTLNARDFRGLRRLPLSRICIWMILLPEGVAELFRAHSFGSESGCRLPGKQRLRLCSGSDQRASWSFDSDLLQCK